MTPETVLSELLQRLAACRGAEVLIGYTDLREWTPEVFDSLQAAHFVVSTRRASHLICPGCEKQCSKDVVFTIAERWRPARADIYCDEPEDLGRIEIPLSDLAQWRITGTIFADALSHLLKLPTAPTMIRDARRWLLGPLPRAEDRGVLELSIEHGGTLLTLAEESMPLTKVVNFCDGKWQVDTSGLLGTDVKRSQEPVAAWLTNKARAAAEARHSKPGGSRDIKAQMLALWASGKYTTRDRCAEEEYAALGISYSTARRALVNAPDPDRT